MSDNLRTHHDELNKIYTSKDPIKPITIEKRVKDINIPLIITGKLMAPETGTIVRWVTPNLVCPKTAKTLKGHIQRDIVTLINYISETEAKKTKETPHISIGILIYDLIGADYQLKEIESIKTQATSQN